ncbi:MAG TPA: NAD(P)/FAD-dependent oxidoreductase [Mycobacteriales bacterium]
MTDVSGRSPVTDVDLLLVGAGPVGLYGAYYAGVRGMRVAVLDSLPEAGGQVTAMYPEKQIYDVAGFPAIRGRDLVANLVEQAAPYDPVYLFGQEAQGLDRTGTGFTVQASSGGRISCRAIVVTGGIGTFTPRRLPAGEEFLGRGLDYVVPRPADHAGRDVVVVGGGDSACDWALTLEPIARSVTLVHRRETFRAHEATLESLRRSTVEIVTNAQVTAAAGVGWLDSVVVSEPTAKRSLPCQGLVAALGFTANLGPLREWGLALHDNRHVVVDSAMRTNLPGVFAAGDITDYDGKVRLISVGFGEVATAVNNAATHVDPAAQLFPGHSSDQPVPAVA